MAPTSSRSARIVAAAAILAVGPMSAGPSARAASPPTCETLIVSPAYRTDRTIACVQRRTSNEPRGLATSTDGGRSWQIPAMSGLVRAEGAVSLAIAFSPAFGSDHALFASTGNGTFVTTDLGRTFVAVDPLATASDQGNPAPYSAAAPASLAPVLGSVRRVYLAYAAQRASARVDVALKAHEPVAGASIGDTMQFIVPEVVGPDRPPLAFSNDLDPVTGNGSVLAFRCDENLVCAEQLFTFPKGRRLGASQTYQVELMNDRRTILVTMHDPVSNDAEIWRSTDWGKTFAPWASVNAVLQRANKSGLTPPMVALAFDPSHPTRAYLRVQASRGAQGKWANDAPPATELYRSNDAGRTWIRIGFRLGLFQKGRDGRLPFNAQGRGRDGADLAVAPDGRLLAIGWYESDAMTLQGVFCSLDGGLHWTNGCPR